MTSSKHDYANYDHFAPNFNMVYNTIQYVSVSNLKLFGPMTTELWGKEVEELSIMLYGIMGWWDSFAHHHIEIFRTLKSRNSSIYWYIDLKLSETFQNRVIYIA